MRDQENPRSGFRCAYRGQDPRRSELRTVQKNLALVNATRDPSRAAAKCRRHSGRHRLACSERSMTCSIFQRRIEFRSWQRRSLLQSRTPSGSVRTTPARQHQSTTRWMLPRRHCHLHLATEAMRQNSLSKLRGRCASTRRSPLPSADRAVVEPRFFRHTT